MENFQILFLMKFGQQPCTIYRDFDLIFVQLLKIRKKSNFDRKKLKLYIQHKNMYVYQEKL